MTNAEALAAGTAVLTTLGSVRHVAGALGLDLAGVDVQVTTDLESVRFYDHVGAVAAFDTPRRTASTRA